MFSIFNKHIHKQELDLIAVGVTFNSYCCFNYGVEMSFELDKNDYAPMILFNVYKEKYYRLYSKSAYFSKDKYDFYWRIKDTESFRLSLLELGHRAARLYNTNLEIRRLTQLLNSNLNHV